ncbi:putative tick transposon [Operophtera brumata]|uniref:Putative tick transposon n=1 Tax=Operophtera brumata TaxID=104452 RepID=A0A0L7KU39_OPEBR|nr:putative tick transposon [Operophtera brumata]
MSVQRSPQGNKTPVGTPGGSQSQPDLSRPSVYDTDHQVSFRKRKQTNCDCECDEVINVLKAFRVDMISALETNLKPMRDDISTMKYQIEDIKSSTEKLLAEHNSIRKEISQLQKTSSATEAKITSLETEIENLKITPLPQSSSQIFANESIINEMQERERRSKNIIVVGLPELTNGDDCVRNTEEINLVKKILKDALSINAKVAKVMRLGKFITGKVRPMKVILESPQVVKEILKNKNKLPENVRVYNDQTPTEKNVLKELSQELVRRYKKLKLTTPIDLQRNSDQKITYQLSQTYQNLHTARSCLNIFYANVRSIRKQGKFDELKCILRSIDSIVHVILLTETWLKSNEEATSYHLPNYTHYYNIRTDSRGGGVSMYVHNNLNHSLCEEAYSDGINYLWIHLEKYALDIGLVYNPHENTNITKFLEVYSSQLLSKKRALVFGDFNLDLLRNKTNVKRYRDMLRESGYDIINNINIDYCTRPSSKTIIDHVCSNLKDKSFHMAIIESPMTDHSQIYLIMNKYKPPPKKRVQYEVVDYITLHQCIKNASHDQNNNYYNNLENLIKCGINESKITKTKILNLPLQDWICKDVTINIKTRNEIWQRLKQNPNNEALKTQFILERKNTANKIRSSKNKFYNDAFRKYTGDPKKMWNLINTLSSNKIKLSCSPPKLITESGPVSDGNESRLELQCRHRWHNHQSYQVYK